MGLSRRGRSGLVRAVVVVHLLNYPKALLGTARNDKEIPDDTRAGGIALRRLR